MFNVRKNGLVKVIFMVITMILIFTACGTEKEELNTTSNNSYIPEYDLIENQESETEDVVNENKVDISEMISDVEFINYNGYGYAKVNVWACALTNRIDKETMKAFVGSVAPTLAAVRYSQGYAYYFEEIVRFAPLEENHRLSNGDTITVVAKVTDEFAEYGVTVAQVKQYFNIDFDETITYTVSGLLEGGTPIDAISFTKQYVINSVTEDKTNYEVKIPQGYAFNAGEFSFVRSDYNEDRMDVSCNGESLGWVKYKTAIDPVSGKIKIQLEPSSMLETTLLSKGYFFSDVIVVY